MSQPGWYPDPSGAPRRYRHWDGSHWSSDTVGDPRSASSSHDRPPQGPHRAERGWIAAIAVLAAITLVVVVVVAVVAQRPGQVIEPSADPSGAIVTTPNASAPTGSDPDGTATPASSAPAASPSAPGPSAEDTPTAGSSVAPTPTCPVTSRTGATRQPSNRLKAGTLQIDALGGWEYDQTPGQSYDYDRHQQTMPATSVDGGTDAQAGLLLGLVAYENGFTDPQTAAHLILACQMADMPQANVSAQITTTDASTRVDGHAAWRLRATLLATAPDRPGWRGTTFDIIVVDLGDGTDHFGEYLSFCPVGSDSLQQQLDDNLSTLIVVG